LFPNGDFYSLIKNNNELNFSQINTPRAIEINKEYSGVVVSDPLFSYTITTDMPMGSYRWYIILVEFGQDVTNKYNWINYDKINYEIQGY